MIYFCMNELNICILSSPDVGLGVVGFGVVGFGVVGFGVVASEIVFLN